MATKKALYIEYYTLMNEYSALKGETDRVNIENFVKTNTFESIVKRSSKDAIEYRIRTYKELVDELKHKLAKEEWLKTDNGKAVTKKYNAQIKMCNKRMKLLHDEATKHLLNEIRDWLGNDWSIRLDNDSARIGIKSSKDERDIKFGYGIDLYFGLFRSTPFQLNYGTMGGFNPYEDKDRVKYLIGFGKFVGDTERLKRLENYLTTYRDMIDHLTRESEALKEEYEKLPSVGE